MNYSQRFKVSPGTTVKFHDIDPSFKDGHESHEAANDEIIAFQRKLRELQDLLYAERKHSPSGSDEGHRSTLRCHQRGQRQNARL